jgi:drug/metabolite transporter (DMT)-like permease
VPATSAGRRNTGLPVPNSAQAVSGGAKQETNPDVLAETSESVVRESLAKPESALRPARRRTHAETLLLTCGVITLNAFGNLALAAGLKHRELLGINPIGYISALFDPMVAAGVGLLILWLLTRMALMSWADLSFVVPVTAAGYVLSAILGRAFLSEQVGPEQWLGMAFILSGSVLVGTTSHKTPSPPCERVSVPLAGQGGEETT